MGTTEGVERKEIVAAQSAGLEVGGVIYRVYEGCNRDLVIVERTLEENLGTRWGIHAA